MAKPKQKKSVKQKYIDQATRKIRNRKQKLQDMTDQFNDSTRKIKDEIAEQEELLDTLTK